MLKCVVRVVWNYPFRFDSMIFGRRIVRSLLNINVWLDRTMICLSMYKKYESEIALLKGPWLTMRTGYIRLLHLETKTIMTLIGKKISLD